MTGTASENTAVGAAADSRLAMLPIGGVDRRQANDRLELMGTLIAGPEFDALFARQVISIPAGHPVYPWHCAVLDCQRPRWGKGDLCADHARHWSRAREDGTRKAVFVRTAQPLTLNESLEPVGCRICPDRPAFHVWLRLCQRHRNQWATRCNKVGVAMTDPMQQSQFRAWLDQQHPYPGYGACRVGSCDEPAESPLGLCPVHGRGYRAAGSPGAANLPVRWAQKFEYHGLPVPVGYADRVAFARWCATQYPVMRIGQLNLQGLSALARAEFQWALHRHAQGDQRRPWQVPWLQALIGDCCRRGVGSLMDVTLDADLPRTAGAYSPTIMREIHHELRLVYLTPAETREAGLVLTEHYGIRYPNRSGYFDLTGVDQRWLRDLLWDHITNRLRSAQLPRTAGWMDLLRKFCLEFGAFLRDHAPDGGHDPLLIGAEHVEGFVAEIRRRERLGLASPVLGGRGTDKPVIVTSAVRHRLFNAGRQLLRAALESGRSDRLGLDRAAITAMPTGGHITARTRSPFPDQVAQALADETNLRLLAEIHDPHDHGLRDMWETIVATGRRAGEVVGLRLNCIGRYNGLAMLWHDQTKVGRYDQAIRIPETIYHRLEHRQHVTRDRFADQHRGQQPTDHEAAAMALFPAPQRNRDGHRSMSMSWFGDRFRDWVNSLNLGHYVAHQARHTLATRLLAHGATLSHIRRYLGHVSDRMAEHYAKVAVSEIEDVLQHVWVAGPGAPDPGRLLTDPATITDQPLDQARAQTLALDLARASTPTQGGFCTFQPVINGDACPWKLHCEGCDKFVLSGADLMYWRRKREQWTSLAERAPDDATADYLHQVFAPTAAAIDGLERALAGLGLLDQALALDLRRPQDYFHALWNTGFRPRDLAQLADQPDNADGPDAR